MSTAPTNGGSASICRNCGRLLVGINDCPTCGRNSELGQASDSDKLSFSVTLSTLKCDVCERHFSIGMTACPGCGDEVRPEEIKDPRDGPLNRARLTALEDLLADFEVAADVSDSGDGGAVLVTDDQFLAFINRNRIISENLIGELKELVARIDLSDEAAISARNTRLTFEAMRDAASRTRAVYDELHGMAAPEQFGRLHQLLKAVYYGVLTLYRECAAAILAVTIEELSNAQRNAQAVLDRLVLLAAKMDEEIRRADPERAGTDQMNRRLRVFVGRDASYDYDGRADLAAVLAAALRDGRDDPRLGEQGARSFRGLTLIDPAALSDEESLFLYVLAAELAASDDPVTVRRRASVLLDILRQALHEAPQAMVSALVAAEVESEQAIIYWLNERDLLQILPVDKLPPEAVTQKLTQSYHALLEGTYRRLTTSFIEAGFILRGASKPHEEIAAADVATRYFWLESWLQPGSRRGDPRFQSLLAGVSVVLRHAFAHGDVETDDMHAVVTHRGSDSTRTILGQEKLGIDELVDCLRDLSLSCHAMRLAHELFRLEFRDRLPVPVLPNSARLSTEVVACLVGLWGLARAKVDRIEPDYVRVRAEVAQGNELKGSQEYAVGAFTLATLFPHSTTVALEVSVGTADRRSVVVPSGEVRDYQSRPDSERDYWFLRLLFLTQFEPADGSDQERYTDGLIQLLARMIKRDLVPLSELRSHLPLSLPSYGTTLRATLHRVSEAITVVTSTEAPSGTRPVRSRALEALRSIRKGLVLHERYVVMGRWQAVRCANPDLERGVRLITQLASG